LLKLLLIINLLSLYIISAITVLSIYDIMCSMGTTVVVRWAIATSVVWFVTEQVLK